MTANNSKHRDQANNVQPYDMSFHGRDLLLFHINNCFIRNSWRIYKKGIVIHRIHGYIAPALALHPTERVIATKNQEKIT